VDETASFGWLQDGRFWETTEALILAAQDGSLLTCHYFWQRCASTVKWESIGHILSACQKQRWAAFKERHDTILGVVVEAIGGTSGIKTATPAHKSTVNDGSMWVDMTVPTDADIRARRPDLILHIKKIWLLDVACMWEPLVKEREGEKI